MLAGRCGRNNSPWKESVAGKKIIQGVRGDLKSRIAATGYLYGLLTTETLSLKDKTTLALKGLTLFCVNEFQSHSSSATLTTAYIVSCLMFIHSIKILNAQEELQSA